MSQFRRAEPAGSYCQSPVWSFVVESGVDGVEYHRVTLSYRPFLRVGVLRAIFSNKS